MVSCSAFGCTNRSTSETDVSFHKIPPCKNKVLRKQWLHNIRRTGPLPKDISFYICTEHFDESCFKRDLHVCNDFFICIVVCNS